jgi:hypothetical protein
MLNIYIYIYIISLIYKFGKAQSEFCNESVTSEFAPKSYVRLLCSFYIFWWTRPPGLMGSKPLVSCTSTSTPVQNLTRQQCRGTKYGRPATYLSPGARDREAGRDRPRPPESGGESEPRGETRPRERIAYSHWRGRGVAGSARLRPLV